MRAPRLGPPKLRHEILRFRRPSRVTSLQPPTTPSTGTWVGLLCAIRLRRMRPKGRGFKPACMRRRTWFSPETENHPVRRGKSLQFWKNFMLAGGQRRSGQRIVRIRKYPSKTSESKGRRLTGSRRQYRPFYPAFCLLCSTFTCILLLAFALSAPASGSVTPRVLVHGTQKSAGSLAASARVEGAKGQVAGKLMSSDGRGVELVCEHEAAFFGAFCSAAGVGPGRTRSFADIHLVTSAARAPPANIA